MFARAQASSSDRGQPQRWPPAPAKKETSARQQCSCGGACGRCAGSQSSGAGFDFSRISIYPKTGGTSAVPDASNEDELVKSGGGGDTDTAPPVVKTGGAQGLSATTSVGPNAIACGGYRWQISWALSQASAAGGWIVQKYDEVKASTRCDGGNDAACNDQGGMKGGKITYWEAWKIDPGKTGPTSSHDNFDDPGCKSGSKGTDVITGTAAFYEGLALPADFKTPNPNTFAGSLPSTTTDPKLPGGTAPYSHTLSVKWDCCPSTNTPSTIVSHHP